jgi:hypothetical protein
VSSILFSCANIRGIRLKQLLLSLVNLNLQATLPGGNVMWTFIRPGTQPGMLYEMIQQLPYREQGERPLIKIHVFSTRDGSMVRRVWLTVC